MAKPIFIIALPVIDSEDVQALIKHVEKGLKHEYHVIVFADANLSESKFYVLNADSINHDGHKEVISYIKQKINK